MSDYISRQEALDRLKCNKPEEGADGSKDRHRYMQWMADINAITAIPSSDVINKNAPIFGFLFDELIAFALFCKRNGITEKNIHDFVENYKFAWDMAQEDYNRQIMEAMSRIAKVE